MKINQLKINGYGKLKEKEIEFDNYINIVQGKNESGKSTLLSFIVNSLYGISRNKDGKEISDFEKYTPWIGEEFSGKLKYELDNKEKFEIFRDFKKKNPKIFNEKLEDISKEFNIDKNEGNQFFYEQTKVEKELFLSTIVVNQQEVELEKQKQNVLIQKIANLVGTGEDKVSYKKAIDRINRRILEEIGTEKSREKPINIITREIEMLEKCKNELQENVNTKYEIEKNSNYINEEINELQRQKRMLQERKLHQENTRLEREKVNIKINLQQENNEKIDNIKNRISKIYEENKGTFEKEKNLKNQKNKLNQKMIIIIISIILINILQWIIIKNKFINYTFLLTIPLGIMYYFMAKNNIKKKEINIKSKIEKINSEIKQLNIEKNIIEENNKIIEKEINTNLEEKDSDYLEKINLEIQNVENKLNSKKIKLHTLELDYKNIEPQLENLSTIEEQLVDNKEKMLNIKALEKSMILAKEVLESSYEKMKNKVTPKFTDKLSEAIREITNNKYTNVRLNDADGLIVELEDGNYIPAYCLSIGTIDQLYLSLRLSMVEELSSQKMPIILDECFAFYDTERLKNVLRYLATRFKEHQIILFTCTNREQEALEKIGIEFNLVEM